MEAQQKKLQQQIESKKKEIESSKKQRESTPDVVEEIGDSDIQDLKEGVQELSSGNNETAACKVGVQKAVEPFSRQERELERAEQNESQEEVQSAGYVPPQTHKKFCVDARKPNEPQHSPQQVLRTHRMNVRYGGKSASYGAGSYNNNAFQNNANYCQNQAEEEQVQEQKAVQQKPVAAKPVLQEVSEDQSKEVEQLLVQCKLGNWVKYFKEQQIDMDALQEFKLEDFM